MRLLRHIRFSLRTLVFFVLLAGAVTVLCRNVGPWQPLWMAHDCHRAWEGAFSPDGTMVVTTMGDGRVWDAETGQFIAEIAGQADLWRPNWSLDGRWLLAVDSRGFALWDARHWTKEPVAYLDDKSGVFLPVEDMVGMGYGVLESLPPQPSDEWLATPELWGDLPTWHGLVVLGSNDGRAEVYDTHNDVSLCILTGHRGHVAGGRISPDGNRLVTYGGGKTLAMWHRRRPEFWWGVAWLPEFWLTVVFAGALVWSVLRDRKALPRPAPV